MTVLVFIQLVPSLHSRAISTSTMAIWTFSTLSALTAIAVTLFCYLVWIVAYRLHFSPISKFSGSCLAALTFWSVIMLSVTFNTRPIEANEGVKRYEFYYDVILRGQYTFHIRQSHAEFGPIIRINSHQPVRAAHLRS